MRLKRVIITASVSAFAIAFLFLAPVISSSIPVGVHGCPPNGCIRYESVAYWAFGAGAIIRDISGYSLSRVTAAAPAGSSSSASYTVTVCTFTTASNGSRVESCSSPSITATSTGVSTVCIITGQPGGAWLRVISDSTSAPVTGAVVTAAHNPAGCILGGVEYTNTATTQTFMTKGTEWTSLDVTDGGTYAFTVQYSGRTYTFTADLRPVSLTCATLYVPSGRTNSTITTFGMTCP